MGLRLGRWRLGEVCRVTMGHLRVTIGHSRVTIGHPRVIMGHLRVTIEAFCDFQYCSDETRLFANFDILIQEKV